MQIYESSNFALCKNFIAPSVVAAVFFSIYFIIDGIIIGRFLGDEALAAMGLVMPFAMIGFAIADTIAIGSSVQISLALGERKIKLANEIFTSCVIIIIAISFILGLVAYFGIEFFLQFMKADEDINALCVEYARVFALFMPVISLSYAFDNYLRICNKGVYVMWVGIFFVLCNILLVYLFVAVLELSLFGAALAMCLGLSLQTFLSVIPFLSKKLILKFYKPKLEFKRFLRILYNGSSEFFGNASGSLFLIFANVVLLKLANSLGVATYAVILYIDTLIISVLMATNSSLQAPLSYFFAQNDKNKVSQIITLLMLINAIFSLFAFVIISIFRSELAGLFEKEDSFTVFASSAFLLFSFNYLFAWFNLLVSAILTAFDKPTLSLIVSLMTNLIVPLCFLAILPLFLGVSGVFLVSAFAEFIVLILSFYCLKHIKKSIALG